MKIIFITPPTTLEDRYGTFKGSGSSMPSLGILMLAASKGTKVRIEADGEDAQEAIDALLELAKNKFNIKY